jgi:hypothetical protein
MGLTRVYQAVHTTPDNELIELDSIGSAAAKL